MTTTRRAIVGGALGILPIAAPSIASAQSTTIRWRLASSYPKTLDTIHGIAVRLSKHVAEITDGAFQIQVYGPGEIVPGLQVLDAVQNDTVEMGHTASVYYSGKNRAFAIDTGLPFGMTPRQHLSWMYRGGGLELFREFFKGPIIAAGGFDREGAIKIVENGDADLVAFGRQFISNPDLPERLRLGIPLYPYNRATFYSAGPEGYIDYPSHSSIQQIP